MSNSAAYAAMKSIKENLIAAPFRPEASRIVEEIDGYLDQQKGETMNAEAPKKTGLEILKELPPIDRIAFIIGSLDKMARLHQETAGGSIAVSRAMADEKLRSRGKFEAYRDAVRLIGSVFSDELKAKVESQEAQG